MLRGTRQLTGWLGNLPLGNLCLRLCTGRLAIRLRGLAGHDLRDRRVPL